jgi:ATP-binding cassette subfamily B protein
MREISATTNVINVVIAHRLSTVMHADRIYVLERGRIAEMGRHDELVKLKGLYYAMWRQQVGERGTAGGGADPLLADARARGFPVAG